MIKRGSYRPEDLLRIDICDEPGKAIYMLSGELDAVSAGMLRDVLAKSVANGSNAVIDLSSLEFIDSSGLGVLIGARKKFDSAGLSLLLRAPRPSLQKVLEMTGLTKIFVED